ncbi:ABC transporter ATP-binding protein, partial [Nonomuraea sp. MCN248]|nr:ABC transporter ATP-binding protein [Nonomuraea corallina]
MIRAARKPADTSRPDTRQSSAAGTLWQRAVDAWTMVWRSGPLLALGSVALSVLSGIWPVGGAWLTKLLLDELSSPRRDEVVLVGLAAGLALLGLLTATLPHVERYLDAQLRRRLDLLARDELFGAVNRFAGLARFESPQFLDRLRLAEQTGQSAAAQIVLPAFSVLRTLISVVGFVVTLTLLSPVMTAVVLLAAVPAVLAEVALS